MNSVLKRFEEGDRGQLIMACGTGKTLTALFIHDEKLAADRTLVLVPSLLAKRCASGRPTRRWDSTSFRCVPTRQSPNPMRSCRTRVIWVSRSRRTLGRSRRSCVGGPARVSCSPLTNRRRRSPRRSGWAGCPPST
ncbi:MAG TPA: DEAD/DEAH box helicase family protein [Mycobacterium sp.]|nr:DEAD/DEAH box helicase family protein [Mycobacterium sp.]